MGCSFAEGVRSQWGEKRAGWDAGTGERSDTIGRGMDKSGDGEHGEKRGRIAEESQKVREKRGKNCGGRGGEKRVWRKYEAKVTSGKKD